jgi:carbon-monoxide dehydrogenase small subunit
MNLHTVHLTVNGRPVEARVEARISLADFLRDELGLTGTKLGCEHGVCGACTVLVGGDAVRSCLMFAVQAGGADVLTVEGLAAGGRPHPLQQAFAERHGLQCGFCTPGFLMSAYACLLEGIPADEAAIRDAMSGTICRCTGYQGIVEAVRSVALGGGADEVT